MKNTIVSYFLASNSGKGFYSLFNELYNPYDEWKLIGACKGAFYFAYKKAGNKSQLRFF